MGSDEEGGKVEKEEEELKEEKRKFPQIFGEVNAITTKINIFVNNQFHFAENFDQVSSLVVLAIPLFLSSASWVNTILTFYSILYNGLLSSHFLVYFMLLLSSHFHANCNAYWKQQVSSA